MNPVNSCAEGGSLAAVINGSPAQPVDATASWTFSAPPFATIAAATLWRTASASDIAENAETVAWIAAPADAYDSANVFYQCPQNSCGSVGNPSSRFDPVNRVVVPATNLDGASHIYVNAACGGAEGWSCPATSAAYMVSAQMFAADLSPVMLERARAEAQRRGLDQVEFTAADVNALPFEDGLFDLCVSYTGLHCFPDPAAALAEMARVLRPGGALRGTAVVKHAGLRQDVWVRLMQLRGSFGPGCTLAELESWLADAGLVEVSARRDGALGYFS